MNPTEEFLMLVLRRLEAQTQDTLESESRLEIILREELHDWHVRTKALAGTPAAN